MTINYVVESTESSVLIAQLASRYFRPGGIAKGVVRLMSKKEKPDAFVEIAHVIAQVHGHVTVDSNLLTLPVVHLQSSVTISDDEREKPECKSSDIEALLFDKMDVALPDVRKFAGDTGTCIFRSPPSVLFSEINIAPAQSELDAKMRKSIDCVFAAKAVREETAKRCTREFAIALPKKICPSFRGASARVFYMVSITVQCALDGSKPVSVHLPFDVYGSEYFFEDGTVASASYISTSEHDDVSNTLPTEKNVENNTQMQQVVDNANGARRLASVTPAPAGLRKGSEIAFELRPSLIHGRVETELMQRAQTSIFIIGKDNSHLVRFLLTKQFYHPGEVLLGIFDFTRASIPCYEVSATLCLEETLSSIALDPDRVVQSKVFSTFREQTLGVLHTNARFHIPHDALPTIKTDLVRFQWLLRFEFSAGASPISVKGSSNESPLQRQSFQWHVPIVVQPVMTTQHNHLANVPHKFYSGSTRVVSLSGVTS